MFVSLHNYLTYVDTEYAEREFTLCLPKESLGGQTYTRWSSRVARAMSSSGQRMWGLNVELGARAYIWLVFAQARNISADKGCSRVAPLVVLKHSMCFTSYPW